MKLEILWAQDASLNSNLDLKTAPHLKKTLKKRWPLRQLFKISQAESFMNTSEVSDLSENRSKSARVRAIFYCTRTRRTALAALFAGIQAKVIRARFC
jgi:hypothetical protein